MGVPEPGQELQPDQDAFSQDVLKIELSGPEYEHFSVVDLPGIFRSRTAISTKEARLTSRGRSAARSDNQRRCERSEGHGEILYPESKKHYSVQLPLLHVLSEALTVPAL